MRPLKRTERIKLIEEAKKVFPDRADDELSADLDEFQGLLSEKLRKDDGLGAEDEKRFKELAEVFAPLFPG
jgi:hypothetical protein